MKSTQSDPREEFLARVNLSDTRVQEFQGFFFLCGGPNDINPTPLRSVRHLIYNELVSGRHTDLADRLRLAEDIQDWFRDGVYPDLVTLEEHLASLSSVILLVVESPGSIAELGAFSVTRAISERLIVLVDESHYESESFIRLGPIRRLESDTGRGVLVHDWHQFDNLGRPQPHVGKLVPEVVNILNDVRELLALHARERVFKASDPGHVMILIAELCDLFGALNSVEIEQYVRAAGADLDDKRIGQYLFLLTKCEILKVKPKGHGRYFFAPAWKPHVTFSFKDSQRVDRDRVRVDVNDFYKNNLKTRAEVVRIIRKAA